MLLSYNVEGKVIFDKYEETIFNGYFEVCKRLLIIITITFFFFCLTQGASCGHGTTVREVKCTRSEDKISVDYEYCASSTKPSDVEKCFVPCITGCQLATWTEWSPCHGDCRYDRIGKFSVSVIVVKLDRDFPPLKLLRQFDDSSVQNEISVTNL